MTNEPSDRSEASPVVHSAKVQRTESRFVLATSDIPRTLRLAFEDDLFLPRYTEPIPIQPEPESVTLHSRRAKILAATSAMRASSGALPAVPLSPEGPRAVSSSTPTPTSPQPISPQSPLPASTPPLSLSFSLSSSASTAAALAASPPAPSFMQQPLQQSAVGRPRGMSSARLQPPMFPLPQARSGRDADGAPSASSSQQQAQQQQQAQTSPSKRAAERPKDAEIPPPVALDVDARRSADHASAFTPVVPSKRAIDRAGREISPSPLRTMIAGTAATAAAVIPAPPSAPPMATQKRQTTEKKTPPDVPGQQQQATPATPLSSSNKKVQQPASGSGYSSPYHANPHRRREGIPPLTPLTLPMQPAAPELRAESPEQEQGSISAPTSPKSPPRQGTESSMFPALWSPKRSRSCSPGGAVSEYDWNKQFSEAIEDIGKLTHNSHFDERLRAYERLAQLAADFNYTVRTYARIIISEVYLPKDQKTIKPLEIGGIVGGDKYIVHRILFKFAVDSKSLYGGDEHAAKVAGHELKSLVHLFNCWERGVNFPMMTLVDYRGFRIVGMPLLPINGAETLVHGSNDAGKTIRNAPHLEPMLRSIGEKLNLKPHLVGRDGRLFYTPVDLEGHQGIDLKTYLVDFSRLFPPQSIQPGHKLGHLYQLLRPEFVRMYEKPLCSDAFSTFICPDHPDPKRRDMAEEHNTEIDQATEYLTGTLVPVFAQRLVEMPRERRDNFQIIVLLHESGINVRHLGLLHSCVVKLGDDYWPMAARAIKTEVNGLLRRKMLELRHPGEGAYRTVVVHYMNIVFGASPTSQRHWASVLVPAMLTKFPGLQFPGNVGMQRFIGEGAQRVGLRDGRCLLFASVASMLGLHFSSTTWHELSRSPAAFERYQPFNDTDLKEMRERVKEMNVAAHSAGFMLRTKAIMTSNLEERKRLLQLAVQQFTRALEGNPDNKVTLRNLGDCLILLGQFDLANDSYLRALQADPEDTNTLYKYAIALDKTGHLDEAEEYYVRSLESCSTHSNCLFCYADFLAYHRKNFEEAERFYLKAVEVDPANFAAPNNLAVFLTTVHRDYTRAEQYFLKAVTGAPESLIFNMNYACFLLHIRRNHMEASTYASKAKKIQASKGSESTW